MADLNIGTKISVDGSQGLKTVKEFKQELKAAGGEVLAMQQKYGEFSQEAVAAAKKVAELKMQLKDSKDIVDAFNPERKFVAFGNSVQGAVGGFAALQGVMGLVGSESSNLERTLLKVQSAMAIAQGFDMFKQAAGDFKLLGQLVGGNLVKAFQSLKGAIAATGIGVLLIALGAVVSYWDDIKEAVSGVSEAQEGLNKQSEKNLEIQKQKLSKIGDQDNVLRLQGKSERQILELKVKQTEEVIKAAVLNLENQKKTLAAQVEAEKRNKNILAGIIRFTTVPLQLIINGIAKIGSLFGKKWGFDVADTVSGWLFDPEGVKKKGDEQTAALQAEIDNLKNQKAGFQLQMREIDKRSAEEARQREEAEYYARNLHLKKMAQLEQEGLQAIRDIRTGEGLSKKVGLIPGKGLTIQGDIDKANAVGGVRDSLDEEGKTPEQKALEVLQKTYEQRLAIVQGNEELELRVKESYESQKLALERASAQQKLAVVSGFLGMAANLFGKQTAAGKTLAIAEATINMWAGATQALREKSTLPQPFSTIQKIAAVGTIVGSGLKSIKEIVKTKVPGGGGSGSVPSVPSVAAPFTPSPQVTTTALDQNSINQLGQAGHAFVLERDIANNRERIERLNRAARIG